MAKNLSIRKLPLELEKVIQQEAKDLSYFNAPSNRSKKLDLIFGKKIGVNPWVYHG